MTTIRELAEAKQFALARYAYNQYHGTYPMCCFSTRKTGEGKYDYEVYCNWLNEWLSPKEFKKKCKQCQKEIKKILEEHEDED